MNTYKWILQQKPIDDKIFGHIELINNDPELTQEMLKDYDVISYEDITSKLLLEDCYEKRRKAYGPIPDQLDEIYHNFDAWKTRIASVKAQFPKPN